MVTFAHHHIHVGRGAGSLRCARSRAVRTGQTDAQGLKTGVNMGKMAFVN